MSTAFAYGQIADALLLLHFGVVLFVVGGLALVVLGSLLGWLWVKGLWFRLAHVAAIALVVAESWFGIDCPLTTLESWLRMQAGTAAHDKGFIEHWVGRALFYDAPPWVFASAYTVFGLLVAAAWWVFPPEQRRPRH